MENINPYKLPNGETYGSSSVIYIAAIFNLVSIVIIIIIGAIRFSMNSDYSLVDLAFGILPAAFMGYSVWPNNTYYKIQHDFAKKNSIISLRKICIYIIKSATIITVTSYSIGSLIGAAPGKPYTIIIGIFIGGAVYCWGSALTGNVIRSSVNDKIASGYQ